MDLETLEFHRLCPKTFPDSSSLNPILTEAQPNYAVQLHLKVIANLEVSKTYSGAKMSPRMVL